MTAGHVITLVVLGLIGLICLVIVTQPLVPTHRRYDDPTDKEAS